MSFLKPVILGGAAICYAERLQGVEWLFGKSRGGIEYYVSPTASDRGQSIQREAFGPKVGPFMAWARTFIGYEKKPEDTVDLATVYVVAKDGKQKNYAVTVNSGAKNLKCFSEIVAPSEASDSDSVLHDLNSICEDNAFDLFQPRADLHLTGHYFGAIDANHGLEVQLKDDVPVAASAYGFDSKILMIMPVHRLFVFAQLSDVNRTKLVLRNGEGDNFYNHIYSPIGRTNLAEWDTHARPQLKPRTRSSSPKASPTMSNDERVEKSEMREREPSSSTSSTSTDSEEVFKLKIRKRRSSSSASSTDRNDEGSGPKTRRRTASPPTSSDSDSSGSPGITFNLSLD
ncbi:hypothetical protein FOZ63_027590 [Perkinsus olseni]|uniref:Uncharacterized protein n=1 Tax=Perkinsus olseni TaxID=32597 RepID=A0A7J6Q8L5_PEROL|nr:hypothetical protein FOZ63_027590 [Perkinsus olseni]